MATQGQLNNAIFTGKTNGNSYYTVLPSGSAAQGSGLTEVNPNDYGSIPAQYQNLISQAGKSSGYSMSNGVMTNDASQAQSARDQAAVAAGTEKAVQVGSGTAYEPTGSAADMLNQGLKNGTISPTDPTQQMAASMKGSNATDGSTTPVNPAATGQAAYNSTIASGTPPPQDSSSGVHAATSSIDSATPDNAPTFYKQDPNDPNNQTVTDAKGNPLSHDQYIAAGGKDDYSNVQNSTAPQDPTINSTLEQNPDLIQETQNLVKSLTPQATTDELNKEITQLNTDNTTLTGLNTQYMNIQNIMTGTEDDIRNEIQASGGLATNSQVMALATARNKVLLKQAKTIQESITNQKNIIASDTKLYSDTKSLAQQQYNQNSSAYKMLQSNQKAVDTATKGTYNQLIKADGGGYAYLYAALQSDPSAVKNAERVLGMSSGELKNLAENGPQNTGTTVTYDSKGNQITTKNGVVTKTVQPKPKSGSGKQPKFNPDKPAQEDINGMQADIKQTATGSDHALSPDDWDQALKQWTDKGYSQKSFISNFGNYAKQSGYFPLRDYTGF